MSRKGSRVIELRLNKAEDMFALAPTDLFSEFRNYLTGVEYCISVLRSQRVPGTVRLELSLPAAERDDALADRLRLALHRYCDQRISYNRRERRAVQWGGLRSLWVGVPIVVIGYLLVIFETRLVGRSGNIVLDTTGWVLVWVGIWYPLDTIFFTPLGYGREIRALAHLRDAEIAVTTWRPTTS
ncbi:MAG TPA: hypothetical protein VHZ33_13915 [Trebonia sp.]|jgi:hypothetical protein|nr:hypothetical protein [Trebonia sp.]